MYWDSIVERKIEAAREEGIFADLPGRGRPLRLGINPFVDKDRRLTFDMLSAAGFAPHWIELDREIRDQLSHARKTLVEALDQFDVGTTGYKRALEQFQIHVEKINELIRELNLLVPSLQFSRRMISVIREVALAQTGQSLLNEEE